jgi:predicted alpha/beta hydrolase
MPASRATGFVQRTILTGDGGRITARFFGDATSARGGVVIVPAMGVAQAYYAALAVWLAAQGWLVLTFDYRGFGLSHTGSLRGFEIDIVDWARFDCAAAVEELAMRVPRKPILWIGHSLGGQIIPFVPNRDRIAKFIMIATGSGYWRENPTALRSRVWLLWFVLVPLLVPLFGYFPGKWLGIVGNLPAGVIGQWRRWCLHPEYALGAEGEAARSAYGTVTTPIVSLSFTDDEIMSASSTRSLYDFYANAPRRSIRISPADVGLERIGHFGFFRSELADPLWREWLLPELDPAVPRAQLT